MRASRHEHVGIQHSTQITDEHRHDMHHAWQMHVAFVSRNGRDPSSRLPVRTGAELLYSRFQHC